MSCSTSCSGADRCFIGDIGTTITVNTCGDVTGATLVALDVQKPDGTTERWVGGPVDTTKIRYTVQPGDFDQAGEYRLQAYVDMIGWKGRGTTATVKVYDLFE